MDIEEMLELPRFEAWLERKAPHAKIGTPISKDACPLAVYLKEETGQTYLVRTQIVTIPKDDVWQSERFVCDLPPWAREFVLCTDATYATRQVTAQEAKGTLAGMRRYDMEWERLWT